MVRVGVVGAGGRMGQEVCRAVIEAPDLELVSAADPNLADIDLRQVLGGDVPSVQIGGDVSVLTESGAEVAVDFTMAEAARRHLAFYAEHGIHAVVGTTGLSESDLADATKAFEASSANAVIAANFAIGAVLLMRFCELAAPFMEGAEIIELHHNQKIDAPSGTALHTAERIVQARRAQGSDEWMPDPTTQTVIEGARGAVASGGIHVHSVRLPGLIAHEEVIFGATGQSLSIRHDAYDRRSFMAGVLLAIRQVGNGPSVTIGLEPLLGF
jgi:4-hydroxy-tetrahydrodipicolinate reductase